MGVSPVRMRGRSVMGRYCNRGTLGRPSGRVRVRGVRVRVRVRRTRTLAAASMPPGRARAAGAACFHVRRSSGCVMPPRPRGGRSVAVGPHRRRRPAGLGLSSSCDEVIGLGDRSAAAKTARVTGGILPPWLRGTCADATGGWGRAKRAPSGVQARMRRLCCGSLGCPGCALGGFAGCSRRRPCRLRRPCCVSCVLWTRAVIRTARCAASSRRALSCRWPSEAPASCRLGPQWSGRRSYWF